jgi:hypothetical protein
VYEQLFVLSLDEEKGNTLSFAKKTLPHALSGGILVDLALLGKLGISEKQRLEIKDASSTHDEILDDAIQEILASEKSHKLSYWVSEFSQRPKQLRERIGQRLVAKNLLYQDGKRYIWLPLTSDGNEPQVPSKFFLKNPVRVSILTDCDPEPHILALLNVASAADLLSLIFTQDELPIAKHRIYEKTLQAAWEKPDIQTIEEVGQAIITSLEDDED